MLFRDGRFLLVEEAEVPEENRRPLTQKLESRVS